ncbi:MAG: hypothetical protein H6705_16840 [Myxococcales bacterium]|nr:hypothetical protein [Myxococcales bacterium]
MRPATSNTWPRVVPLAHPPCTVCGALHGHHRGCPFDEPTLVEVDDELDDTLDQPAAGADGPEASR